MAQSKVGSTPCVFGRCSKIVPLLRKNVNRFKESVYGSPDPHDGLTLTDLVHALVVGSKHVVAGGAIGLMVAIVIIIARPKQYTASTDMVLVNQQDQIDLPQIPGLSSLLPQLGGQLLQDRSSIKDAAYAYILMSPSVRLRVARDTFAVDAESRSMTLVEYVNEEIDWGRGEFEKRIKRMSRSSVSGMQISMPERRAMEYLDRNLGAFSKPQPRTITLEVTTDSPALSVAIADRMIHHFRDHLRTLRREKLDQEARYLQSKLEESQSQLRRAETRLSQFEGRNQGLRSARLETKRNRLERDVRMAEREYKYLLERTREVNRKIEGKRSPFETLDRPTVPLNPSNAPRVLVIVVLSLLGVFSGSSVAFGLAALNRDTLF